MSSITHVNDEKTITTVLTEQKDGVLVQITHEGKTVDYPLPGVDHQRALLRLPSAHWAIQYEDICSRFSGKKTPEVELLQNLFANPSINNSPIYNRRTFLEKIIVIEEKKSWFLVETDDMKIGAVERTFSSRDIDTVVGYETHIMQLTLSADGDKQTLSRTNLMTTPHGTIPLTSSTLSLAEEKFALACEFAQLKATVLTGSCCEETHNKLIATLKALCPLPKSQPKTSPVVTYPSGCRRAEGKTCFGSCCLMPAEPGHDAPRFDD